MDNVVVEVYRWAGKWGPFSIKILCGECALTQDIILDTLQYDLPEIPVKLISYDWLNKWWEPLVKGAWHAPIVLVNGTVISQGVALNRGVLVQAIVECFSGQLPLKGNHLFGKVNCAFCEKAKIRLEEKNIPYHYHDVVREIKALYEMLSRVKPFIGLKTPVTVPQIWLDGQYIGGYQALIKKL